MPLILTEEQTMLAEAAGGFLAEQGPISHLRRLRDGRASDGVSRDLWRAFGDMGLAGVIVVSAPAWKQRKRVLARPGMTAAKFRQILRLQTPDPEKRRRADHIIDTGTTFTATRAQVSRLVACLGAQTGR